MLPDRQTRAYDRLLLAPVPGRRLPDEGRVRAAVVENGLLRRPWHGYDYDPLTSVPPLGFADAVPAFAVQEREDGAWVELKDLLAYVRTVGDVVVETLVAWGVTQVFGMVGHSMHPLLPAAMPSSPDARPHIWRSRDLVPQTC